MLCPNDNATLVISERSGVEIDYCPECRGVWLDRGELDKIIEKADNPDAYNNTRRNRNDDQNDNDRGGFLSDLFGFGD